MAEAREVEAEYMEMWRYLKAELELGSVTRKLVAAQCDTLGSEYVAKLLEIITSVEFKETAYCFVHQQQCPLTPRAPDSKVLAGADVQIVRFISRSSFVGQFKF